MNIPCLINQLEEEGLLRHPADGSQINQAVKLIKDGSYQEALEAFNLIYRTESPDPFGLLALSICLAGLGQNDKALTIIETAQSLDNIISSSSFVGQFIKYLTPPVDLIEPTTVHKQDDEVADYINDTPVPTVDAQPFDPEIRYLTEHNETLCIGWYRGEHCNWMPFRDRLKKKNGVDRYILKGWLPEKPLITKTQKISAFGSCFALHLRKYLQERGYDVGTPKNLPTDTGLDVTALKTYVVFFSEGLNNTYALSQQFEWAYENKRFSENLWYDSNLELAPYNDLVRETTKSLFDTTDVFILTIGLSEVWYNKQTEDVFWRAIPKQHFDPAIHGFRVTTVQENLANLEKIYTLIRKHRGDIPIIVTLSPVPLIATFRPVSCITANSVSKSILRVAIDELKRAHEDDDKLFYFPSYEIVKEYFTEPYSGDNRHVNPEVVDFVMDTFSRHYLIPE